MLLDVSHPLTTGMPIVSPLPDVRVEPLLSIKDGKPLNISLLTFASHAGTHIDAPSHAVEGAATIDEIPVERFCGPAVVAAVAATVDRPVTVRDILDSAPAPRPGDMVFVSTGWDERYGTPDYFDHPALAEEVGDWAVEQRLSMIGTDTLTPEVPVARRPAGFAFPLHRRMLGNDVLIAENLRGLRPAAGRRVMAYAFPIRIARGDAGPARVVLDLRADAS
jgi:kynurenine formamidase